MKYTYWLSCMPFSNDKKRMLLWDFISAASLFEAKEDDLTRLTYLKEKDVKVLTDENNKKRLLEEYEKLGEMGIKFCPYNSAEYPSRLQNIYNPPFALFYKGELPKEDGFRVAVVGARGCSSYGQKMSEKIGEIFGRAGIDVISGMAKGVDSASHYGALKGGGKTYAVLGCGPDEIYPLQNRELYNKILLNGGIISEFPPKTLPRPEFFPMRNRIISGLCDAVIVTEAKRKSGSLITADFAMEQGREVFCVPGRLGDSLSEGTNDLIRQGAGIISSMEQLMSDLNLTYSPQKNKPVGMKNLTRDEAALYGVLEDYPKDLDSILEESKLTLVTLFETLSDLIEKGMVKETFKNNYVRA